MILRVNAMIATDQPGITRTILIPARGKPNAPLPNKGHGVCSTMIPGITPTARLVKGHLAVMAMASDTTRTNLTHPDGCRKVMTPTVTAAHVGAAPHQKGDNSRASENRRHTVRMRTTRVRHRLIASTTRGRRVAIATLHEYRREIPANRRYHRRHHMAATQMVDPSSIMRNSAVHGIEHRQLAGARAHPTPALTCRPLHPFGPTGGPHTPCPSLRAWVRPPVFSTQHHLVRVTKRCPQR